MTNFSLRDQLSLALFNGQNQRSYFKSYPRIYSLFPQRNPGSIRVLLESLRVSGCVQKIEQGGEICFALTNSGREDFLGPYLEKIFQADLASNNEYWDHNYHLILVHVPEIERDIRFQIKELLYKFGFRLWQQSIWLSPRLPREVLKQVQKRRWEKYLFHIKAISLSQPGNGQNSIYELWQLSQLRKNYQALIKKSEDLLKTISIDVVRYNILADWESEFLQNLRRDPLFSDQFFNLSHVREKAARIFINLSKKEIL